MYVMQSVAELPLTQSGTVAWSDLGWQAVMAIQISLRTESKGGMEVARRTEA